MTAEETEADSATMRPRTMRRNQKTDQYVCYQTSLSEDLVANAECLAVALALVSRSANAWKWAIVAADMLVTTGLVLYLNDSTGTAALTERSRTAWLEMLDGESFEPVPKMQVANLNDLIATARSDAWGGSRAPLALSDEDVSNVTNLHSRFRNEFVHFKPVGMALLVDGLPAWLQSAVNVTQAALTGSRHYWDPETDEGYWQAAIALVRQRLQQVERRVRRAVDDQLAAMPKECSQPDLDEVEGGNMPDQASFSERQ